MAYSEMRPGRDTDRHRRSRCLANRGFSGNRGGRLRWIRRVGGDTTDLAMPRWFWAWLLRDVETTAAPFIQVVEWVNQASETIKSFD